jgi:GR25 family glycosyltransferase involved in LPS biosynthesis
MSLPSSWAELCSSPVHMLGLKRFSFRREYSAARLAACGFSNINFVDAFDGYRENVDEALRSLGILLKTDIKPGPKACFYTHVAEWKKMIDEDIPYRVFFEDDVLGHLDLPNGLGQTFWDATPKDFDMLYLGSMMNPAEPELYDPNNRIVNLPSYCTHAYIMTLEGAKKIIKLMNEINSNNIPLNNLDITLVEFQRHNRMNWYCWNGTNIQKSFPTFDEGLPWQAFSDVILPEKDMGLFWQNMRLGTTISHEELQLTIPKYRVS